MVQVTLILIRDVHYMLLIPVLIGKFSFNSFFNCSFQWNIKKLGGTQAKNGKNTVLKTVFNFYANFFRGALKMNNQQAKF